MKKILQAVQFYFEQPLKGSEYEYADARLVEEREGKVMYGSVSETQPIGKAWDLLMIDRISDQLSYAHVGYANEQGYRHEVLTFLRVQSGWKLVAVLRAQAPAQYGNIVSDVSEENSAFASISDTLLTYCNGVYNLDAEGALAVFGNEAHMQHPTDGISFADVNCEVFRERWADQPHPSTLGIPQYAHIYHIELMNAATAVAKVGVAKLNDHFNDYLFLLKTDGQWHITHKLTQCTWKRPMPSC